MKIGENIRALRKARGFTQEQLADMLGISFQAVSKWENNASMPDISLLPAIAKSIDEFVGEAPQFDDITMLGLIYYGNDRDKFV